MSIGSKNWKGSQRPRKDRRTLINQSIIYLFTCWAQQPVANYRVSTEYKNKQIHIKRAREKKTWKNQTGFLKLKYELLKISTNLQTKFAAETHLSVGQWLEEQMNIQKFRIFPVGTRKPTVSRTGGQNLVPLKTFIKNRAPIWRRLTYNVCKLIYLICWYSGNLYLKKSNNNNNLIRSVFLTSTFDTQSSIQRQVYVCVLVKPFPNLETDQVSSRSKASGLYSESSWFKSRSVHRLYWESLSL
jgi:hypothetical protein